MKCDNIIAKRPFKTVYRDNNKVIKLFDKSFSKSDVLNEALNQGRIEETGLLVPKLLNVSNNDGKWAIESEFIEGKTLEMLMEENPEKMDEYIELFVDIQISVHDKKAPLLNKLKDKMHRKILETDLDATICYELCTRLESMPKHKKVCHGDFNPSNIILSENGKTYILDWAHATQGNASADVAQTYLLFSIAGKGDIAEKYLNLFCKKTDTPKKYVQQWIPIVAASQLSLKKKNQEDFLMHWIDVVEYE